MTADAARDRLAALLPDAQIITDGIGVVLGLTNDQAVALADEIEAGRAAVAAVARVEALCDEADSPQPLGVYFLRAVRLVSTADLRRALAPATGTDAASGDGDG